MNRQIYTLGLYLLLPFILLYFLYRGIKDPRYLSHFGERFGFVKNNKTSGKILLIHCASLGETKAATPLITSLIESAKFSQIIITNTTPTGRDESEKLIQLITELNRSSIKISYYYLPIDYPFSSRLFLNRLNLDVAILMETELWPNFIHQCKQKNIPVILANARMSKKSATKYQRHPKLTKSIFSDITLIAAQYQSDEVHFLSLGVEKNKLHCVGSIKFNIEIDEQLKSQQKQLKDLWRNQRPCWIACSIHPGEFDAILNCHKTLLSEHPDLLLIAVPRHPEQFEVLKAKTTQIGLKFINRSQDRAPDDTTQIVVGDTMGELTLLCGVADIAFVGGSLINRGGHNPLEPAACGLPVLMGRSDYNFSDVSQIMQNNNCLTIVDNETNLTSNINALLGDKNKLKNHYVRTNALFKENGQAVKALTKITTKFVE